MTDTTEQAQEHLHVDASVIDKIGELTRAATAVQTIEGTAHLILPPGFQHIDLTAAIDKIGPAPRRKAGTVQLADLASFLSFLEEQAEVADSYIYADPDTRTLTAVLNDHYQAADSNLAGWRDFRAVYRAELSREFERWLANNGKPEEQEKFAIFLEDNIADIAPGEGLPNGDTLLAVALTLQAKTEVNFSSHRRLDNGQIQLTYTENIDARAEGGAIDIPREFAIGARLFKGGEGYRIRARLKYRLGGGKVKFWYELDRPDNALEAAFGEYIARARETGFTVLLGKP